MAIDENPFPLAVAINSANVDSGVLIDSRKARKIKKLTPDPKISKVWVPRIS